MPNLLHKNHTPLHIENSYCHLPTEKASYRPDIDGIRALAVLCVVVYHAFPTTLKGGFIGVDIFFVISGYLISSIIVQDLENQAFSILHFYNRRIRRIFPALVILLFATIILGWFSLLPEEYSSLGKHILGGSTFISNFILWKEDGYFDVASQAKPLLHLWSLGIEEQFYIVFPLILWLCVKNKIRISTTITVLCCLSFLANLYLFHNNPAADFYSPITRAWELMAGAVLSTTLLQRRILTAHSHDDVIAASWRHKLHGLIDNRTLCLVLALSGFALIATGLLISSKEDHYPGWKAVFPTMGALCLLAAGPSNAISRHLLSNRLAVFIGLISYPLYLLHWPLLSIAHIIHGDLDNNTVTLRLLLIFTAFVLATITYCFIERPIRLAKNKHDALAIYLFILLILIGLLGWAIHIFDGLPHRPSMQRYVQISEQFKEFSTQDSKSYEYDARIPKDENTHTQFSNMMSNITVAVYGDSHALSAFQGIQIINNKRNINTLLLSRNSSKLPIIGLLLKNGSQEAIIANNILNILCTHDDIKAVFIFCRGQWVYDEYKKSIEDINILATQYSNDQIFHKSMQIAIDELTKHGKKVYIVVDNPRLKLNIKNYIERPLKKRSEVDLTRKDVTEQQLTYRRSLHALTGATVIETIDCFCPVNNCKTISAQGIPYFKDRDHLSRTGSELLANEVLKPYLDEIK